MLSGKYLSQSCTSKIYESETDAHINSILQIPDSTDGLTTTIKPAFTTIIVCNFLDPLQTTMATGL